MQSAKKIARDQPKFTALRSHYLREWGDRGLIFWTSLLPVEVTRTIKDQGDFSMTAFSRILAVYLLTQLIMIYFYFMDFLGLSMGGSWVRVGLVVVRVSLAATLTPVG